MTGLIFSPNRKLRLETEGIPAQTSLMEYRFADCCLDLSRYRLTRGGEEVHVEPQVFDLLALLARAAPDLVSYDDMIAAIWKGRIVSDSTLAARVNAARKAVGDDGKRQAVIRTVPRRGVQLSVPLEATEAPPPITLPPSGPLDIRYAASADGSAIAWTAQGDGPPILRGGHWMSHLEFDSENVIWPPFFARLGAGRRLVRYDPRGTGLSDRSFGHPGLEDLVADMKAVADAAGLDRFPLYAISQSVPISLAFAATYPERVSRLILMNGFVTGSTVKGDGDKTETMVGMIRSGWGQPGSPFMKAVATLFVPGATQEEVECIAEMQARSASAETAAELRRVIGEIDVSPYLDKVHAPALILHCTGDAIQSHDESKRLAARLPNARFLSLASDNHMLVPSDPVWSQVVDEIDAFLSDGA